MQLNKLISCMIWLLTPINAISERPHPHHALIRRGAAESIASAQRRDNPAGTVCAR
jgi:hypothetical protein